MNQGSIVSLFIPQEDRLSFRCVQESQRACFYGQKQLEKDLGTVASLGHLPLKKQERGPGIYHHKGLRVNWVNLQKSPYNMDAPALFFGNHFG